MIDDQPPPLVNGAASEAADRSLVDDVRQLADDARTLLEAELAYQKSRAAVAGAGIRGIAGWGALAAALVFFALMALVMGALLALAPSIGGWAAMAVMVAGLLVMAAISGLAAASRWKRMSALLADQEDDAP
ncbi:MAG: hypothetical protein RLZZ84_1984 [Pseudomonadota bacterium]|jgi:hypothetical protein